MRRTGYLNPMYAASMAEFGRPCALANSDGFLLERAIPRTPHRDAMGLYPLFCCGDWSGLPADLERLGDRLISVVLVTDPFGEYDPSALACAFSHGLIPYKIHHIIDLQIPLVESACEHHRRNARKSLERLVVEEIDEPVRFLETWCALYADLIARHRIDDLSRFSTRAFEIQLTVPGLVALRRWRTRQPWEWFFGIARATQLITILRLIRLGDTSSRLRTLSSGLRQSG